jgi:DNA-binding MarR family transcriptional regulator
MFHAVMARKERMAAVAAQFELTLAQAHLLRVLQFSPARTMTSIAEALACDASNVTGIVDRLESRGFIERGSADHDRRIKTITLTERGRSVVAKLTAGFLEPPDELRRLPESKLRSLRALLAQAFGHWREERPSVPAAPVIRRAKP